MFFVDMVVVDMFVADMVVVDMVVVVDKFVVDLLLTWLMLQVEQQKGLLRPLFQSDKICWQKQIPTQLVSGKNWKSKIKTKQKQKNM